MLSEYENVVAVESIKQAKARYLRGVDTSDSELVRGILAEDCLLDYMGCCTDPVSGKDYLPQMNVVMRGRTSWSSKGFASMGIVSVHQAYNFDIAFDSDTRATSICAMTDRLFMPENNPYSVMTGYGYYHETYEKLNGAWLLKTLRISRLRVQVD